VAAATVFAARGGAQQASSGCAGGVAVAAVKGNWLGGTWLRGLPRAADTAEGVRAVPLGAEKTVLAADGRSA
jgi:hypothetical protein